MGGTVKSKGWRPVLVAAVVAACMGTGIGAWADTPEQKVAPISGAAATNKNSEGQAKAEWARLSLQIKDETDLETIVGIHNRFLDQFPDSALADKVRESQQVYEGLVKSKAQKFRGKWVAAEQIEVIQKQSRQQTASALELYQAGKWKESLEAARKVSAADRENADALAIAGVSAYRLKMAPAAQSYFEKLAALDSDNVLAENNLAVIAFELKQPAAALVHYGKALQSGAKNALVLDNAVEMLTTYVAAGGDKNAAAFRDLNRKAAQVEGELIPVMRERGLLRRGATWVTQEQLDAILKELSGIEYQMRVLDKQYGELQQQIADLKKKLVRDIPYLLLPPETRGGFRRSPHVPPSQADLDAQAELDELRSRLAEFQKPAAALREQYAAAEKKYTGVQRILEPGTTPDALPALASATTKPAATEAAGKPDALVKAEEPAKGVGSVAASAAAGQAGGAPQATGKELVAVGGAGAAAGDPTPEDDYVAPLPEPEFVYVLPPVPQLPQDIYGPPPPVELGGYAPVPGGPAGIPSNPEREPPPYPGYMPRNAPLPMTSKVFDLVPLPPVVIPQYQPPRRVGIPQQPGVAGPWAMTMGLQTGQPLNGPPQVGFQMLPTPSGAMPLSPPTRDQVPHYQLVPHVEGSGRPTITVPVVQPLRDVPRLSNK